MCWTRSPGPRWCSWLWPAPGSLRAAEGEARRPPPASEPACAVGGGFAVRMTAATRCGMIARMARVGGCQRARRLRLATVVALLLALLASAAASWGVHSVVRDQEHRLLKERGNELNLVLTSAIGPIATGLASQGELLTASHGSRTAYETSAQAAVADAAKTSPNPVSFGWLRRTPAGDGWVVLAAAGDGLHRGQVITDARARTLGLAVQTDKMVAGPLIGADRTLGFALGPPAAPPGTVLYRETPLGPLQAPQAASSAPFAELALLIYGSARPDLSRVLAATTTH